MTDYMLTTTDNPFSPVTQHDEWFAWDMANHNTYALLARVAYISPELTDEDQALAIQDAIDVIVKENVSGVHIKVPVNDVPQIAVDDEESDESLSDHAA